MRSIVFSYFLFLPIICIAQIDSLYIQPFTQNASARIYQINKYSNLTYEFEKENKEINYKPNNPMGIGIGGSYKGIGINLAYGFNFMRNDNKGKTKAFDLQYHHYGRKLILDVFIQNYKGFYKNININNKDSYELHPDIELTHFSLFSQYVFNNKKFSYKAAFNQSERQIKSAGSLQIGGGLYYNRIRADSSLVLKNGNKEESYQLGANLGYSYTVVINKFYLTGALALGGNLGTDNHQLKGTYKLNPTFFPRFSAGYNSDLWSINLSFVNSRTYILFSDDINTYFDSGKIQLALIRRFDFSFKK